MRSFVLAIVLLATAALLRAQDAASTPFQARTPAVSEETPTPSAKPKTSPTPTAKPSPRATIKPLASATPEPIETTTLPSADRIRDPYPGPCTAREPRRRSSSRPQSRRRAWFRPRLRLRRHPRESTAKPPITLPTVKPLATSPRSRCHVFTARPGDLDAATNPESFCDRDAETISHSTATATSTPKPTPTPTPRRSRPDAETATPSPKPTPRPTPKADRRNRRRRQNQPHQNRRPQLRSPAPLPPSLPHRMIR